MFSKYRHRLTIQEPKLAQDQTTGAVDEEDVDDDNWNTIGTIWCRILPLRGTELLTGDEIIAKFNTRIYMRWSPFAETITAAHRGIHQGTKFNFINIVNINMANKEIEISAISGLNNG